MEEKEQEARPLEVLFCSRQEDSINQVVNLNLLHVDALPRTLLQKSMNGPYISQFAELIASP